MKRRVRIVLFFLFLIAPIAAIAQSASDLGLVLEGTSEKCLTAEIINPKLSCYKLRMVLRNKGLEPVIIINPNLGYGTGLKELIFSFAYKDFDNEKLKFFDNKGETPVIIEPDPAKTENFRLMAQVFDSERPSENMTIVLQHMDTFVFAEKFEVEPQYKHTASARFPVINSEGKRSTIAISSEKVSASSFRLVYEFSFLPLIQDAEFLEKLSNKWKKYGSLPIGKNGTYTITSRAFPVFH